MDNWIFLAIFFVNMLSILDKYSCKNLIAEYESQLHQIYI